MDSTPNTTNQRIDWSNITFTPAGFVTNIVPAKVEEILPRNFRYLRKRDGSTVLQGAYFWTQGWNTHGCTWRDIPTVDEE